MVWNSFADFIHMGGYGLYVWGSVGVTFAFMLSEVGILIARRRAILCFLGKISDNDVDFGDDSENGNESAS